MKNFKVRVHRYYRGGEVFDGCFDSFVYAIDGNKFLVYDDCDCCVNEVASEHFEWVDITKTMPDLRCLMSDGIERHVVELLKDEKEPKIKKYVYKQPKGE